MHKNWFLGVLKVKESKYIVKIKNYIFRFLVSDVLSSSFSPFWPTSSGPRPKLLEDSTSLKFLLETRLKSKSFDILDDLLGFQVQKYILYKKVMKRQDIVLCLFFICA